MVKGVPRCIILTLFVTLLSIFHQVSALEASFTPAPDKDTGSTDGPLPLSQNQRNQLLQLDQQIAQSPNPQETLKKVAESNGMSSDELGSLLMRNRSKTIQDDFIIIIFLLPFTHSEIFVK